MSELQAFDRFRLERAYHSVDTDWASWEYQQAMHSILDRSPAGAEVLVKAPNYEVRWRLKPDEPAAPALTIAQKDEVLSMIWEAIRQAGKGERR